MKKIKSVPVWWIVLGSLVFIYLAFIVRLLFFSGPEMALPQFVPVLNPIGLDLKYMLSYAVELRNGSTPYIGYNNYPPLAAALFLPLTAIPFASAYFLITALTVAGFLSVVLALPLVACRMPDRAAIASLTVAGLVSYGLLLEIEQGQFNVIALALCAWAIFFFHEGRRKWHRPCAYVLFTLAVQLKLYPAIFIFAFARGSRDLKRTAARLACLGGANIALLFALGPAVFRDFLSVMAHLEKNNFIWVGNHSIRCFAMLMANTGVPLVSYIEPGFYLVVAGCFAAVLALSFKRNARACFKYLIVMCALAAMLAPQISHDYKLPCLTMAFAFFIGETGPVMIGGIRGCITAALLAALSIAHADTLLSSAFKPMVLLCNTPVLLTSGVLLAMLMAAEKGGDTGTGGASATKASAGPERGQGSVPG